MKQLVLFFVVTFTFLSFSIVAQVTPNIVDSKGLKQGMWREFKVPINFVTEKIGIKLPEKKSEFYYLTKDEDRKFFPIIECIGEYQNSLKVGVWTEYYGNGKIKNQIEYKNGVPYGKCLSFWGNGVLKEEFIISSADSTKITIYDKNGNLHTTKMVSKIRMTKIIYEN